LHHDDIFRLIYNLVEQWATNRTGYNIPYKQLRHIIYFINPDAIKMKGSSFLFSVSSDGWHYELCDLLEKPLKVNMHD